MELAESLSDLRFLLVFILCLSVAQSRSVGGGDRGSIVGNWKKTASGKDYYGYEGIPYANPPVDDLRFKPAQFYTRWPARGLTLVARKLGFVCTQYDLSLQRIRGSEDCLYLNVYAPSPNLTVSSKLPVLFYIHGSDFQTGSGGKHNAKFLLERNIILVTFNYRLGPFGFLSTGDDVVPGNMGLKDQALALQWVSRNIKRFGGDPANVTIIGHGAGGASVHYHYLSQQSKYLFRQGISLSGTALAPWAFIKAPWPTARKLAATVRCPNKDSSAMVRCLRRIPSFQIMDAARQFRKFVNTPLVPFGPVIEKGKRYIPFDGTRIALPFLTQSPIDIIISGQAYDVPWITGVVGGEGLAVIDKIIANENRLKKLNDKWETISPVMLNFEDTVPEWKRPRVAKWIRDRYMGEWPFAAWTAYPTVKLFSDRLFVTSAVEAALLHAHFGKSPVHFYRFTYRGLHSFSELASNSVINYGVSHMDDLAYYFDLPINLASRKNDRDMREKLIDFWISYATSNKGTPNVGFYWPAIPRNGREARYLQILGPSEMRTESLNELGARAFWESLGIQEDALLKDPNRAKLDVIQNFYSANHILPCNRSTTVYYFN